MNPGEVKYIEDSLGIKLPDYYKSTILQYPYPKDSFADEFLLPNNPDVVVENNNDCLIEDTKDATPFIIGNDGGEELYYINVKDKKSNIYVYYLEIKKSEVKSDTWPDYLREIDENLKEIEDDERVLEKNKKWWQLWI